MKKIAVVAALLLTTSSPVFASDACQITLCMYGRLTGNSGGSECSKAERDFFVNAYKKGIFNPAQTFNLRKSILNACQSADSDTKDRILSRFGRVKG